MKVYEEMLDIHKEAFVREEVNIEREESEIQLKRKKRWCEELDIDTKG